MVEKLTVPQHLNERLGTETGQFSGELRCGLGIN
jgi:hypothetical protein